jgi:hypothetical protein
MTRQQALDLARQWAKRRIPAGPIAISWDERKQATNKVPLTPHGHNSFVTDLNRLDQLFGSSQITLAAGEVYGVGLHPGPGHRVVLDVDTKGGKQGDKVLAALEAEHGPLPPHPIVDTASGGTHRWLAKPEGVPVGNPDLADHIEVRADAGWVVAPGTFTPWGSWTVREGTEIPAPLWPDWIAHRLNGHKTGGNGHATGRWQKLDRAKLHPLDLAALQALEALGGHGPVLGPNEEIRVTRPGKKAGASASIGHIGPGVVKVFTDDWAPLRKESVYDVDELEELTGTADQSPVDNSQPKTEANPITLDQCHDAFGRWLGDEYDLDVLDIMLCTLAAERLTGDPLWLLVISGPGAAKTETVQACAGIGAHVESTLTGDAALLSGTPPKERAKHATGGLLRRIGDRGVLVIKDVTSILSMSRDRRAEVIAALREIHDGYWSRSIGAAGGATLTWTGRLVVIGAVTTAWDTAHAVISTMGDRFVTVRLDSIAGRPAAFRHTMANTGDEITMRAELAAAVAGVIAGLDEAADLTLTESEVERLLPAADLVTLTRTGVEFDYKGDVVDAHAPEMPTRFARQLQQIIRGGIAIGIGRDRAVDLAIRAARDSMPPVRLAIVDDLATHPHSTPAEIRRRVDLPWRTVDRQCQALHMLRVVACDEVEYGDQGKSRWHYSLAAGIDPEALKSTPDLAPLTPSPLVREGIGDHSTGTSRGTPAKSGAVPSQVSALCGCGAPLDQHAGPDCAVPVIHPSRPVENSTVTRPDITIHHATTVAVASGDKALAAIDAASIIRTARFSGWELPLEDVPRLVAVAAARGWTCVEVELATRP